MFVLLQMLFNIGCEGGKGRAGSESAIGCADSQCFFCMDRSLIWTSQRYKLLTQIEKLLLFGDFQCFSNFCGYKKGKTSARIHIRRKSSTKASWPFLTVLLPRPSIPWSCRTATLTPVPWTISSNSSTR